MRNIMLNAPVENGQFMSLKDCGEAPFVNGAYGRGAAVRNTSGRIISPFSGRVFKIFRNAIELESNDGIKLLIQIGGNSFYEESVKENQPISSNQILAYFNVNKIVMFTVKNDSDFGDITFQLCGQNYTIKGGGNSAPRANNSTGDDDMEGQRFTILGETDSGKTCYLLGMYYEMSMSVAGYTVIATDPDADKNLTLRYELLKDKSRGRSRFPDPSNEVEKFNFYLQYAYENIAPFQWIDYPGGFLNNTTRDETSAQYKEVAKSILESQMIFICIDGANLVGNSTREKIRKVKTRCAKHISPYLGELMNKDKDVGLPPIAMLITKYDMCMHDTNADELREIIEEAFDSLFEGEHNQNFVAIIPVSLGNTLQDDSYQGDLDPINVHLPILLGINFALIDQLHIGKNLIENQREHVSDLREWKRYEDNRWAITRWVFGGRDPDDIQYDINKLEEYIRNNRQLAGKFKKSLKRMNSELAAIDMIFASGTWLDERSIRKMWADIQSIADYF